MLDVGILGLAPGDVRRVRVPVAIEPLRVRRRGIRRRAPIRRAPTSSCRRPRAASISSCGFDGDGRRAVLPLPGAGPHPGRR